MDLVVKGNKAYMAKVESLADTKTADALSHEMRLKIIELLRDKDMFAIDIARALGVVEQKVYYHIKLLKEAGIVREIGESQMRGSKAKLLTLATDAIGIVLRDKNPYLISTPRRDLPPLIINGVANFRIVVGSPDPHGPQRARARDGFIAAELAAILAGGATTPWPFVVTDIDHQYHKGNLVLLGGPVVNILSAKYNKIFPVRFEGRNIKSPKKVYSDDWIGFIAWASESDRDLLIIAGRSRAGTRAAVLYIKENFNSLSQKEYVVLQGFDEDSDGIVDTIEVLEEGDKKDK